MNILLDPLKYQFMQYSFIQLILISFLAGIVGVFLILRNWSFIAEALSHAVFPGIIISFLLKINLFIGAVFTAIIAVLGINSISTNKKVTENTATGILFTSAFAFGVVILSSIRNFNVQLSQFIIGNILGITKEDIILTAVVLLLAIVIVGFLFNRIILSIVDPDFAESIGINIKVVNIILYILIALTIVVSIQAIGNILQVALLIIPSATARLLSKNVKRMIFYSIIVNLISSFVGLYISYYFNLSAGATIVLVSAVIFFVVNFLSSNKKLS